jgi:dihydroflavonol-4-reductase
LRIFLTGATGYIGRALALRFQASGHEVRALVRPTSVPQPLHEAGIATFPGDIRDRASMREGMSGADWVVHAAAELNLTSSDDRMAGANVDGSENVASLAWKLGVGRFLSISSMARWGGSPDDGTAANEATAQNLPQPTRYCATKAAGEDRIQEYARKGLRVNTVFPSLVYGPPGKKEGANAILRALRLGRFPMLIEPDKLTSWVFLDDVVDGIVRVMEKAPPGRGFLLAGEAWTIRRLALRVGELSGTPPPRRSLSARSAKRLFRVAGPLLRLVGKRLPVPLEQLDSLSRHWNFDDTRARTELDWRPRGLDEGLATTLRYLADEDRPRD